MHFIDVGQGGSILIDTPEEDVLIDGGPVEAGSTVVNYLTGLNMTHIHLMIATHVHRDHVGGLVSVLETSAIIVDEILVNGQSSDDAVYVSFLNLASSHVVSIAQRGQVFSLAATTILTFLNPVQPLQYSDPNENSIVVRLQVGIRSFLLTGDAGSQAEQGMLNAGLNLHSDVLKVGHHGSRYSSTQSFLNSVSPSYAIISAGLNNPYGHPSQETIDRLLAGNVTIYGTYRSGTIVAFTDGVSLMFQDTPEPIPEIPITILQWLIIVALLTTFIFCVRQRVPAGWTTKTRGSTLLSCF